jgi:TonB family protein
MKIIRFIFSLIVAGAALRASAEFQSAQVSPDNPMPQYPGGLKLSGITRGYAVVAVSIDTEGKVQDALVLAYTRQQFAWATLEAVRSWKFIPARLDGMPVPIRTEMRFDFTLEGAVITTNLESNFLSDRFDNVSDQAAVYRPGRIDRLDQPMVRIAGDAPHYSSAAAKAGVHGKVEVHFYIDEQGGVRLPAISGGQNAYLMEQAVAAVRNWKFSPPTSNGRPVLIAAAQEFDFGDPR